MGFKVIKNSFERLQKVAAVALCIVLAGSFFSCGENEKDDSFPKLKEISLCGEIGSRCQWKNIEEGEEAKLIIINSKKELENYIYIFSFILGSRMS